MRKPDRHLDWRRLGADRRPRFTLGVALTVLVAVGATGAYAAVTSSGSTQPPSGAQIAATPAGPGRLVRAYGLDPTLARGVSALQNGDEVAVVDGSNARCLIRERSGRVGGEACTPLGELGSVGGVTVTNQCGSAGSHLMEITALAPEGVTDARLIDNDGTSRRTAVEDGTVKFDGTNPQPNEPYPTAIEWLSDGVSSGTVLLPVEDGQFCLPTS